MKSRWAVQPAFLSPSTMPRVCIVKGPNQNLITFDDLEAVRTYLPSDLISQE